MRLPVVCSSKRVDQIFSTLELFAVDLVSNATQVFLDSTLRDFTKDLREQPNVEGQWEIETLEMSYPSMLQNAIEGVFCFFFDKKFKFVKYLHFGTQSTLFQY